MKKIKIVGLIIVFVSLCLIAFIKYIDSQNKLYDNALYITSKQKSLTQDIAKNVFYIYRNDTLSLNQLNNIIEKSIINQNLHNKIVAETYSDEIIKQQKSIKKLENEFYKYVNIFKDQNRVVIAYANILLRQSVKEVYSINLELVQEFDKCILLQQRRYSKKMLEYEIVVNALIVILTLLVLYLFTQVRTIISFIQTFNDTSNKIIKNSSIKDLEEISVENNNNEDIKNAVNNFNNIVQKINHSIEYSANQIEHTSQSLEQIESNIEEFMDCCIEMNIENKENINIIKKEDAVIESLDELMNLSNKLKNLQNNLQDLIKNK